MTVDMLWEEFEREMDAPVSKWWWAKVFFGLAGLALIFYYLPMYEILVLFTYIVVVPMFMLFCLNIVGQGTWDGIRFLLQKTMSDLGEKVAEHRHNWQHPAA